MNVTATSGMILGIFLLIELGLLIWTAFPFTWFFEDKKWERPIRIGETQFRISMFFGLFWLGFGIHSESVIAASVSVGLAIGIVQAVRDLIDKAFGDDDNETSPMIKDLRFIQRRLQADQASLDLLEERIMPMIAGKGA